MSSELECNAATATGSLISDSCPMIINNDNEDESIGSAVSDEDNVSAVVDAQDQDDDLDSVFINSTSSSNNEGVNNVNVGTGWLSGSMLIINAALGAGLLNFPSAFHQAGGVLTASIVQLVLLGFIVPALIILAYCSDWNGSRTLQEVLSFTWGKKFEKFTSFCIAVYCFGTCITFLIIIGDQFDRIFASLYGHYFCHEWYMNRNFSVVVTSVLFILPFCYPKTIDFLKHISSIGVISVIYVTLLIIVRYYDGNYVPGEIKTHPTQWTDTFLVIPTICFGYQCHVSVIPIYSCFKKRTIKQFSASISLALVVCVFTYTVAATFGYWTFGSKIHSDILESYDAKDPFVLLAVIAISVKTYTTYPILSFCGIAAVNDLWVDPRDVEGVSQLDPGIKEKFRVFSITIWFITSLAVAVVMPNIGSVIQLLGSLAAVFIFIFPGLCLLRISEKSALRPGGSQRQVWLTLAAALFLAVGAFIFGCVFTQAIIEDFIYDKKVEVPLCVPLKSWYVHSI